PDATEPRRGSVTLSQPVDRPSWLALRCTGADGLFAHTSPVVVRVNGEAPRERGAALGLARLVEQTREWVADHGRFTNPKARPHLLELCGAALGRLGGAP